MDDKKLSTENLDTKKDVPAPEQEKSKSTGEQPKDKDAIQPTLGEAATEQPEYQTRVIEEKAALDEKITKLSEYLSKDDVAEQLGLKQHKLLHRQLDAMTVYSDILGTRIQLF